MGRALRLFLTAPPGTSLPPLSSPFCPSAGPFPELLPPLHRWWSSPTPPWRTSCGWVSSVIAGASSWWWQTRGAYWGECSWPCSPIPSRPRVETPKLSLTSAPCSAAWVWDSVYPPLPTWLGHCAIPGSDGLNLLSKYSLRLEGHVGPCEHGTVNRQPRRLPLQAALL